MNVINNIIQNEALVSSEAFGELMSSSVTLTRDFGSFVIHQSFEALPDTYRGFLGILRSHLLDLVIRCGPAWTNFVKPILDRLHYNIRYGYDELNRQSAQVIDPLVKDFERRYPSSAGRIGSSLVDRFLVCVWLLFLMRVFIIILRGVRRLIRGKRSRNRRHNKLFKADPLFGNPVTPPQNKGVVSSSCSSGNATPEKPSEQPPAAALRTVKKRIVISR